MTKCPRDYETAINKHNSAKIKKLLFLPSSQWDSSRRWGAWYIPTSCTEDHELIPQPRAHLQVQCQKLKTTLFNPPNENLLLKYLFNHQREKPDDEPEDNVQLMQSMGSQWSWISLEQATHCNFKLPFKHSEQPLNLPAAKEFTDHYWHDSCLLLCSSWKLQMKSPALLFSSFGFLPQSTAQPDS